MKKFFIAGKSVYSDFGVFRTNRVPILSLFLAIHKVSLQKSVFAGTRFLSKSALAELSGLA